MFQGLYEQLLTARERIPCRVVGRCVGASVVGPSQSLPSQDSGGGYSPLDGIAP